MCTQAAYAVVLNIEHFVFYISCKHKNKLMKFFFSLLCWLKNASMLKRVGSKAVVPNASKGKGGKHTTHRIGKSMFLLEKDTCCPMPGGSRVQR